MMPASLRLIATVAKSVAHVASVAHEVPSLVKMAGGNVPLSTANEARKAVRDFQVTLEPLNEALVNFEDAAADSKINAPQAMSALKSTERTVKMVDDGCDMILELTASASPQLDCYCGQHPRSPAIASF